MRTLTSPHLPLRVALVVLSERVAVAVVVRLEEVAARCSAVVEVLFSVAVVLLSVAAVLQFSGAAVRHRHRRLSADR